MEEPHALLPAKGVKASFVDGAVQLLLGRYRSSPLLVDGTNWIGGDGGSDEGRAAELPRVLRTYANRLKGQPAEKNEEVTVDLFVAPGFSMPRLVVLLSQIMGKMKIRLLVAPPGGAGLPLSAEVKARNKALLQAELPEQIELFAQAARDATGGCKPLSEVLSGAIGMGSRFVETFHLYLLEALEKCACKGLNLRKWEDLALIALHQHNQRVSWLPLNLSGKKEGAMALAVTAKTTLADLIAAADSAPDGKPLYLELKGE